MAKDDITIMQQAASASAAACIELSVGHPLWTIKVGLQKGLPFTLSPSVLYRGVLGNLASMIPITVMQLASKNVIKNTVFSDSKQSSAFQNVASAAGGGAFAATLACPVEMVMTNMKEGGPGFVSTTHSLMNQGGVGRLYSGFIMTALRDGCFLVGFAALPGVLQPFLQTVVKQDGYANSLSKVASGVTAAVCSQAFDTIKTAQQTSETGMKFFDAIKKPYVEQGLYGYFKGGLPRGMRVASAVCIMSTVTENMNTFFKEQNNLQTRSAADHNNSSKTKHPSPR